MPSWRLRLPSESGNAVIEFVFFMIVALAFVVQLSVVVSQDIRVRSAAQSLANESLRTWQITGEQSDALTAARFTAKTYELRPNGWRLQFEDFCVAKGLYRVRVDIEGVTQIAQGFC